MIAGMRQDPSGEKLWAKHWGLDPNVLHLNHGSFGACPREVLASQQELRDELERDPTGFLVHRHESLTDRARAALGAFLGAPADDLVFVPNATTGVNAVLRSLPLSPGDELLATNHEYNACRNVLEHVAARRAAKVVIAGLPFPVRHHQELIDAVLERISPRTRLVLIDHVTSPSALILPIEPIVRQCAERGIWTLIDGAHGPGMLPLDVAALGCSFYTGNLHKWVCAPKGAAFLYARPQVQAHLRPLTISHGANSPRTDRSRFQIEFGWTGTHDPTPYLVVPEALRVMEAMAPGGWPEVRARNHELVLQARDLLTAAWDLAPTCPDAMQGSMAALVLERDVLPDPPTKDSYQDPLERVLSERYAIRVPVIPWPDPPMRLLRISAQLYNRLEDYQRLADAGREAGLTLAALA